MDSNFWVMILEIVVFLPFIIFLIFLSLKYGSSKLQGIQKGRYIKIHERTSVSKENSLMVVQMGKNAYVMSSANGKMEILKELASDELEEMIAQKTIPQYKNIEELWKKIGLKRKGS